VAAGTPTDLVQTTLVTICYSVLDYMLYMVEAT